MTESRRTVVARRWAGIAAARLRRNRRLLGAALIVLLAFHAAGGGLALFVAGALLLLLAAALAGPTQPFRKVALGPSPAARPPGMSSLSAEKLAAAIVDPLIVADATGAIVMANQAAAEALGDVRPGLSLLLKFRAPEMQDLIEIMLAAGAAPAAVDYLERVPVERAYRVSAMTAGPDTGLFVLVFRDQSETRRIDRMRADFIANASHELRTPLASIAGFVETLRGPARNDPEARERFLAIMQAQTSRMARLIEDLLSLSRLEMKAPAPDTKRIDLAPILESVVETLRPLAGDNGVEIENHFGARHVEVSGDRDELFQVFQNLLENACKYGRSGGRVVLSRIEPPGDGPPEIGVEIRDFGPGIAPEHIPRVTERFYRVDVGSSRAQKGTGLGLSIVKHIVGRHRGRLVIHSSVGEGSAFSVFLPTS